MNHEKMDSMGAPKLTFRSFFFSTGIGFVVYYFLRNDWIWGLLNDQEKMFIKKQNSYWNNYNPGYEKPDEYQGQGGRSFNTIDDRTTSWEGKQIENFFKEVKPERVLEIGPGSGYYTRQILDFDFVKKYYATDINLKFLNYINNALPTHPRHSDIQTEFYKLEEILSSSIKVDAIILLSALHHIPDRGEFIQHFSRLLSDDGSIFFYEPAHSLTRILQLAKSFILHGWFLTSVVKKRNNYMTHHFCTISETKKIAKKCNLFIKYWNVSSLLPEIFKNISVLFTKKMIVILKKLK